MRPPSPPRAILTQEEFVIFTIVTIAPHAGSQPAEMRSSYISHVSQIGASEFMTFIFQHGCLGHRATKSARLEGRPRSVVSSSLPSVVAVAEWAPFWDGFNLSMPLKREGGGKSVLERRQNLITREL